MSWSKNKQVVGTKVIWKEEGRADLYQTYPGLRISDAMGMDVLSPSHAQKRDVSASIDDDGWGMLEYTISSAHPPVEPTPETKPTPKRCGPHVACKRCGVVYEPRGALGWVAAMRLWGVTEGRTSPFRTDENCLLGEVPMDKFCPRCETHLLGIRKCMLWALANLDVVGEEIEKDKRRAEEK